MEISTFVELVFGLLGGLALFIFGMRTMSGGLSAAAGEGMRTLLGKATRNRMTGAGLGTLIGFLVQSSASTVLFIGFIDAGLMTLSQSIGPMMGANIGTTLSIQLISFKLADYCLVPIAIGLAAHLLVKGHKGSNVGLALVGFGLLFLGMSIMGETIKPHRELFQPWLARINGNTISGLLLGTLLSAIVTGVVQSSGAVIGMAFAMVSAGAITDLPGIYPIIVGANVGTCVTGLLGSIGATIAARRAAVSHLLFNLISTLMALAATPLFYAYIPATSGDLVHQAANANTIKMFLSALLLLPFAPAFAKLIVLLVPSRTEQPEPTHLDINQLNRPELAIVGCLRELQRTTRICAHSLHLAAEEFILHNSRRARQIRINEKSVNAIKSAMRDYLARLARQHLSKRQAILIGHIDRCMSDLERVGDHIANLSTIAGRQRALPSARFIPEAIEDWLGVHRAVEKLLAKVIESLDPETAHFQELAEEVLQLREEFGKTALAAQQAHFRRLEEKTVTPIAGMLFNDYLSNFWRITKHIKSIALAEEQPQFWIKREKLSQVMPTDAHGHAVPDKIRPDDYLDKLQSDDFR